MVATGSAWPVLVGWPSPFQGWWRAAPQYSELLGRVNSGRKRGSYCWMRTAPTGLPSASSTFLVTIPTLFLDGPLLRVFVMCCA